VDVVPPEPDGGVEVDSDEVDPEEVFVLLELVDPPLGCPLVDFVGPSPSKRERPDKLNPRLSLPSFPVASPGLGPASAPPAFSSSTKLSLIRVDGAV